MLPEMISAFMSLVGYAIVGFGLWKLNQMVTELGEIKEILGDIRRQTDSENAMLPSSTENLARAVSSASYPEISGEEITHSEPQH